MLFSVQMNAKFHGLSDYLLIQVIRLPMDKMAGRNLYSRLVPLALLLIDGISSLIFDISFNFVIGILF